MRGVNVRNPGVRWSYLERRRHGSRITNQAPDARHPDDGETKIRRR
jgi:hypothetical protein